MATRIQLEAASRVDKKLNTPLSPKLLYVADWWAGNESRHVPEVFFF